MKNTLRGRNATLVKVMLVVIVVAAIGVGGYAIYKAHTDKMMGSATHPTDVTFEITTPGAIGPACTYPTTVDSTDVCFEPTEQQYSQMLEASQGYLTIQIKASAYTDHEVLYGSAVNAPGVNTKVLRAVKIYSMTGI